MDDDALKKLLIQETYNTGELAMAEAKKNGTWIVYKDSNGNIVREYPDGKIEPHLDKSGRIL